MNTPATELVRLPPTLAADRFRPLGERLLELLRSLSDDDWNRPTIAGRWTVRDVVAHLLDTGARRVALERGDSIPPAPDGPIAGPADLTRFIDRMNGEWVAAMQRVSPPLLIAGLEWVESELPSRLAALDPWSSARFAVSWAGDEESATWFDVARELTERWHHQEQVRLAVGAPSLDERFFVEPVMDTFLRALPFRYRAVDAPSGTSIGFELTGRDPLAYTLRREGENWLLWRGSSGTSRARIEIETAIAWRLLTKGISPSAARSSARVAGDADLLEPFFGTIAIVG